MDTKYAKENLLDWRPIVQFGARMLSLSLFCSKKNYPLIRTITNKANYTRIYMHTAWNQDLGFQVETSLFRRHYTCTRMSDVWQSASMEDYHRL